LIWKVLFSLIGLASLTSILYNFGFARLGSDLLQLGWWVIPLALSVLPVIVCYSLAWLCVTPELPLRALPYLCRAMLTSVAWNNLSPFVKMLGEPVKVLLIEKRVGRKAALKSTLLYNIVHILGTLGAFLLGASIILLLFPVSAAVRTGFLVIIGACVALTLLTFFLPQYQRKKKKGGRARSILVKLGFWMRWSFSKIRVFSRRHPLRFWAAVALEVGARFVEGATFYVAFLALGERVSLLFSALLDVGRALLDNVFFFIPYQVGSREAGILVLSRDIMKLAAESTVSAAILYRLVEIFWMGVGYILWIKSASSRRSST
jgi:hypothetical protein